MATHPLVFVSHKHADREIAETLARFVREKSAGRVRVHLSSSPDFEGPRFGKPLNDELKRALAAANAVVLVFTDDSEDWSYCMWECGVATDPKDANPTAVVVMQCTADKPKPFSDQLRVDARDADSVMGFVKALLTTTDLFIGLDEPITGFAPEGTEVKEAAADLHERLEKVLPSASGVVKRSHATPYMRVCLEEAAAKDVRTAHRAGDTDGCEGILRANARISESKRVSGLFGMDLTPSATLGDVLTAWQIQEGNANQEPRWFSGLAEQIGDALIGRLRPIRWAPYKSTGEKAVVPLVTSSCNVADGVELDVYMAAISPRPIPVDEKMVPLDQMYRKDRAQEDFSEIKLTLLVGEMNTRGVSRLPLLDAGRPHSIIHRATINDFVVQQLGSGDVSALTLEDLLTQHGGALDGSYAEVPRDSSVEDARKAMGAIPGCQDVYVTQDGLVVGWLANVMFIQG